MNEYQHQQQNKHTHVWIPWGSEVDNDWQPLRKTVYVRCTNSNRKGKPCGEVRAMDADTWRAYRASLPSFQRTP